MNIPSDWTSYSSATPTHVPPEHIDSVTRLKKLIDAGCIVIPDQALAAKIGQMQEGGISEGQIAGMLKAVSISMAHQ